MHNKSEIFLIYAGLPVSIKNTSKVNTAHGYLQVLMANCTNIYTDINTDITMDVNKGINGRLHDITQISTPKI